MMQVTQEQYNAGERRVHGLVREFQEHNMAYQVGYLMRGRTLGRADDPVILPSLNRAQAIAVIANGLWESNLDPHAKQISQNGRTILGRGILQWNKDRWQNYQEFVKKCRFMPYRETFSRDGRLIISGDSELTRQLAFAVYELTCPRKLSHFVVESVTLEKEQAMKKRFTEEQIIDVLREHDAGGGTGDVCRRHGISSATFYKWKAKFGGLEVSDARRLRALEGENSKLKKLLAEAELDKAMMKELLRKN